MKDKKMFVYCELCNKMHEDVSPPSEEQYKQGLIQLGEFSSVLLDVKGRKSHCKDLKGIYCNIDCLVAYIKQARGER